MSKVYVKDFNEYTTNSIEQIYTESNPPIPSEITDNVQYETAWDEDRKKTSRSKVELILSQIPKGFIHDYVYTLRGYQTTTLFSILGALFAVSSVLQRRTYLPFGHKHLYPNLYLLFVAPPAIVKKTTAILFQADLIRRIPELFHDNANKDFYSIPIYEGAVTPEGMFDLMTPKTIEVQDYEGGPYESVSLGSRLCLIVDDLPVFMGRQTYNTGQIPRLLTLYDCKARDNIYTKKDKLTSLENVYFNFFAGSTEGSFTKSIPEEARGQGLMSRFLIAHEPNPQRCFSIPQIMKGAPDEEEMVRRLGFIAENQWGPYQMSEEAFRKYDQWYFANFENARNNGVDENNTRSDILILKTAMLIRAQVYGGKRIITEDDMKMAILLVEETGFHKKNLISETEVLEDPWQKQNKRVASHLRRKGFIERVNLMRNLSKYMSANELNEHLKALKECGSIRIKRKDSYMESVSRDSHEIYIWAEENEERQEAAS
jgi:hypothetical protein